MFKCLAFPDATGIFVYCPLDICCEPSPPVLCIQHSTAGRDKAQPCVPCTTPTHHRRPEVNARTHVPFSVRCAAALLTHRCPNHLPVFPDQALRGVAVQYFPVLARHKCKEAHSCCPLGNDHATPPSSLTLFTVAVHSQILEVYASRLCFYCDSQSDPTMRDQVAEVQQLRRSNPVW